MTREMMTGYYQNLKQGQGRGAALRKVQLSMLKRKGREHPFYWASFIQSGEWAIWTDDADALPAVAGAPAAFAHTLRTLAPY